MRVGTKVSSNSYVCAMACRYLDMNTVFRKVSGEALSKGRETSEGKKEAVPGVLEFRDFCADTAEILPQHPQCPGKEDGVDLQSQEEIV